jgi:hypothetical protein
MFPRDASSHAFSRVHVRSLPRIPGAQTGLIVAHQREVSPEHLRDLCRAAAALTWVDCTSMKFNDLNNWSLVQSESGEIAQVHKLRV